MAPSSGTLGLASCRVSHGWSKSVGVFGAVHTEICNEIALLRWPQLVLQKSDFDCLDYKIAIQF